MRLLHTINIALLAVAFVLGCSSFVEIVKGQKDFSMQIKIINEEVNKWYKKETSIAKDVKAFLCHASEAHLQSKANHWPRQMMKVLQVATGVYTSSRIDKISTILITAGLKHNVLPFKEEFMLNFKQFLATQLKYVDQTDDMSEFVLMGQKNALCAPYRSENERYFDFKGAINDLVQIAKIENIDDKQFVERVVRTDEPISQLYSASIICQIIDALTGEVTTDKIKLELDASKLHEIHAWPYPRFRSNFEEDSSWISN